MNKETSFVAGFIIGFIVAVVLALVYIKHEINARVEQLKNLENIQEVLPVDENIPKLPENWRE
jgi:septation ring formation regulator EzrA|tara:strand:+ start:125 stop:313 length:189 start_codon:yes stop_codon:yes gene_type:complete